MIQDELKEIERLARMAPPSDFTIKIAKIAAAALAEIEPDPEVKLEKVEYRPPEPEPIDLESVRIRLQTGEKVELPAKPEPMVHDLLEKTDQEREEETGMYDPSIPLEESMSDDDEDRLGLTGVTGEIVFNPDEIDPEKLDPRDV